MGKYILGPFCVIKKHKLEFGLWILFVIIAGQLGTLINLVSRSTFGVMSIKQSLLADSVSGNFYTFALVMTASLVGSIFIKLLTPSQTEHRRLIVPFTALTFMLMLFSAVFFSFKTKDYGIEYKSIADNSIGCDIWQLVFFVLSIVVAVYSFGLERLPQHKEYDDMAEYRDKEQEKVDKLKHDSQPETTSDDVKL